MLNRQVVLAAIDQQTDVERIVDIALTTAKARGADVHVIRVEPQRGVHVDHTLGLGTFWPHDDSGVNIRARLASILRSVDHEGVRIQSVTLRGEPERVIPAYAQLHHVTILVLERDYGSSRFWQNGRVVDEMARHSAMPLLVLPKRQKHEREELRRIVAPVDFSIASALAVRTALDLSRRYGARVTLLHALKDVPQHAVFSGSEALKVVRRLPAQLGLIAERLRRKAASFGADDVDTEVATGVADGAILEFVTRSDADLVVMGIAHRSWFDRLLFGSTLRRVLRQATVPVLVVPVVAGAHAWPDEPAVEQISGRAWTESAVDRVAA